MGTPRTVKILVSLPPDLIAWLDVEAAAAGQSRSWQIETAVRQRQVRLEKQRSRSTAAAHELLEHVVKRRQ